MTNSNEFFLLKENNCGTISEWLFATKYDAINHVKQLMINDLQETINHDGPDYIDKKDMDMLRASWDNPDHEVLFDLWEELFGEKFQIVEITLEETINSPEFPF